MSVVGFNTLEAAEVLRAAGVDEAQAQAIVRTVHRAMSEGIATKEHVSAEVAGAEGRLGAGLSAARGHFDTELAVTKGHFSTELAAVEGRLDARIASLRADMLKTAIGIVVTNVTVTVALLKLIP